MSDTSLVDGFPRKGGASIREVAERAGVAVSSVSRVLTGHPDTSPRMRERVHKAMEECGYEPNMLAQSLRRGATMSIGFIVSDISNPLMAHIALGAETTLHQAGYSLLISNAGNDSMREVEYLRLFRQRQVDGVLLSLADETFPLMLEELRRFEKPVVLMDRTVEDVPQASSVVFDHRLGVRAAAQHLLNLGHRHIGLIVGPSGTRPARERVEALTEECAAAGATPTVSAGAATRDRGHEETLAMMGDAGRPTALICGSNQVLPGALAALRELRLSIPADLSLITTDRLDVAEFHSPPIAAIARDSTSLGVQAAHQLLARLKGEEPEETVLATSFDSAASCAPPTESA